MRGGCGSTGVGEWRGEWWGGEARVIVVSHEGGGAVLAHPLGDRGVPKGLGLQSAIFNTCSFCERQGFPIAVSVRVTGRGVVTNSVRSQHTELR